jgi:hypothetical protein
MTGCAVSQAPDLSPIEAFLASNQQLILNFFQARTPRTALVSQSKTTRWHARIIHVSIASLPEWKRAGRNSSRSYQAFHHPLQPSPSSTGEKRQNMPTHQANVLSASSETAQQTLPLASTTVHIPTRSWRQTVRKPGSIPAIPSGCPIEIGRTSQLDLSSTRARPLNWET